MSEPKRYHIDADCGWNEVEASDGEFVRYEDYARLKAEVERLIEAGDELSEWFMDIHPSKKKWNAAKGVQS